MAKLNKRKETLKKATGEIMKIGEPKDQADQVEKQDPQSDKDAHVYSRKGKGSAAGRRRFTTMLHPELRRAAVEYAGRDHGEYISLADVVEQSLIEYLEKRSALTKEALQKILSDKK
jgi:hypothetical protein